MQHQTISLPHAPHPVIPRSRRILLYLLSAVFLMCGIIVAVFIAGSPDNISSPKTDNGPVLSLDPPAKTVPVGQTLSIGLTMNTNDDTVSAAEIHLTYDNTALEVTGFTNGALLPVELSPETHENGELTVILGVQPASPFKGSGTLGSFTVKALAAKQSTVSFTDGTVVAAIGKTSNALTASYGSTITGTTGTSPAYVSDASNTPTLIHFPTASNTPTL